MIYLLLGLGLLAAVILAANLLQKANRVALVRGLKWAAIGAGVLAVPALAATGRLGAAVPLAAAALAMYLRFARRSGRVSSGSTGQTSRVETSWLRMTLDHDTGSMTGTVLLGDYAGRDLASMGERDLQALYRDCLRSDEPSAQLLESYLDRSAFAATWRQGTTGGEERTRSASAAITLDEARDILGVHASATAEEIQAAHRRLMMFHHPDRGGSTYLAAKINGARDVLLGASQRP